MSVNNISTNFISMDYDPSNAQYEWIQNGWGGGVRYFKIPFAYNTPNLLTGAPLYIPTPGDILVDAFISVETAWDGINPAGDIRISGSSASIDNNAAIMYITDKNKGLNSKLYFGGPRTQAGNTLGLRIVNSDPVVVTVTRLGLPNTDPGSTTGSGFLYIAVCSATILQPPF